MVSVFRVLLPDETPERHSELQAACFTLSNSPEGIQVIAKHMQPSANAFAVLEAIQGAHQQVVISNTAPASLPIFIEALGMGRYFGPANALAVNQHIKETKRTKQDVLNDYLQGKKYDELIVIGDSESDMQLARAVGAKAYLYAHAGVPFRAVHERKINDLQELLKEL